MTQNQIIHLLSHVISLAISTSVLGIVWKRRRSPGALAFSLYMLGQSLWMAAFIFELISTGLPGKIIWNGHQWLAGTLYVIALPAFAIQFTEYKLRKPGIFLPGLLVVPILFLSILVTDSYHHWIYKNTYLAPGNPFPQLHYDPSPIAWLFCLYAFAILSWSLYILLRRVVQSHNLYRTQLKLIALGIIFPISGALVARLGAGIIPPREAITLTAIIGNLIIAWGLIRFRVFEVASIGRDQVFEALEEPVVILDNKNNIVDINSAMLVLLNKTADEVIGQPAKVVFDEFPIPIKQYTHSTYARTEASFDLGGMNIHYELTVWPLYNSRKEMTGRIYISHDITALKQLENELRKLNTQLEDRVIARTRELAEAYDTTLEGWARALELRDKETEGHTRRVTDTTLKIALKLEFPDDMIEHIRRGAILHDIGKMGIPDEILHKPDKLSKEEREIISKHPETAYKLLKPIQYLEQAMDIPYCHHEKWDGTGYPRGLKGREIPVAARIFAIADVWDALSSERPYNKAWSHEKIIAFFIEQSGKHFDPHMVNIFLDMLEKGEI